MDPDRMRGLLEQVRTGALAVDDALESLADLPFRDLGFARVDHHRALRTGAPEVIFGQGKTPEQIVGILREQRARGQVGFVTRIAPEAAERVCRELADADHDPVARTLVVGDLTGPTRGRVAIACAGTSDIPVAEEAAVSARVFGLTVDAVRDVGVAGLHRVLSVRSTLEAADVVIVIAGMEGALASVVAGLISSPVIAVPTSVGYGASFGGLAALLGMLSGCAAGVSVVNIDNGFGAACVAARMVNRAAR